MKNLWWKYLLLLLLPALLVGLFYWRRTTLQEQLQLEQTTGDETISNIPDLPENQVTNPTDLNSFPLSPGGEGDQFYRLDCHYSKLIIYRNYQQLPLLPGNWRSLVDIACQYLNSQAKLETIYLPLHIYQPETQQLLLVGGSIKQAEEARVLKLVKEADEAFYEAMMLHALDKKPGLETIKIVANFPDEGFKNNRTRGVGFDTLLTADPPYTREDLSNFYQTGFSQYLPAINGKAYFWPVANYSF